MKSYLTAGIRFSQLLRLVRKNSITLYPKYILRLLFITQSAAWSEIFSWIERRRYGKKIEATTAPDDPIFIIGHWRTGSTLLHQILDLDPTLAAPSLIQVAEPECFITGYYYYFPVFSAVLPSKRPMDNVKIGINEPQEDEYAIYRITASSPIERLVFPEKSGYFLTDHTPFLPVDTAERKEWLEKLRDYYQKLYYFHGKRIVSKNPFNSMRIKELSAIFPKARFIHIVRHPCEVVPSTINMWNIVVRQNRLNRHRFDLGVEEVTEGLARLLSEIEKERACLNPENYCELRFEDLENDAAGEIEKIYSRFGLSYDEDLDRSIRSFMNSMKSYGKNVFQLSDEEKNVIRTRLAKHMEKFNYL